MKRVKIGAITSIDGPEDFKIMPDDRQEIIKVVGGIHIQDGGYVPTGDVVSFKATFSESAWSVLRSYWLGRSLVDFTDGYGAYYGKKRIIVKSYSYKDSFKYYSVELELWGD